MRQNSGEENEGTLCKKQLDVRFSVNVPTFDVQRIQLHNKHEDSKTLKRRERLQSTATITTSIGQSNR